MHDFHEMCSTLTILMFFVILPRCTCICILLLSALECMYYNALYKSSYCIVLYSHLIVLGWTLWGNEESNQYRSLLVVHQEVNVVGI
jgi:hypothetical protein